MQQVEYARAVARSYFSRLESMGFEQSSDILDGTNAMAVGRSSQKQVTADGTESQNTKSGRVPQSVLFDTMKVDVIMEGMKRDHKACYDALKNEYSGELDKARSHHNACLSMGESYLQRYL